MKEMTDQHVQSLTRKVDLVLSEIKEIREWQAKVDRGIEGEPVHGNPSYISRITANKDDIKEVKKYTDKKIEEAIEIAKRAHIKIDKIIYIIIGAGGVTGGVVSGVMKLFGM